MLSFSISYPELIKLPYLADLTQKGDRGWKEAQRQDEFKQNSIRQGKLRPTLDKGPGSNFLRTNLDWFEANWILESDYTLVPSLILGSPNQELSFLGPNQLIFPPKQVPCRFSLNLPLMGLWPLSEGLGTNLKLSTNKIAWIHWSLDPCLKSALINCWKISWTLCYPTPLPQIVANFVIGALLHVIPWLPPCGTSPVIACKNIIFKKSSKRIQNPSRY
jgi:hypothetical protein